MIFYPTYYNIEVTPQIEFDTLISDTANWMLLEAEYNATGGERFFTIGNFRPDSTTTIDSLILDNSIGSAYYYIDYVQLYECSGLGEQELTKQTTKIYPNPSAGNITVYCPEQALVSITNALGKVVFTESIIGNSNNQLNLQHLSKGIYFIRVRDKYGHLLKNEKLIKQ